MLGKQRETAALVTSTACFNRICGPYPRSAIIKPLQGREIGLKTAGDLANVGINFRSLSAASKHATAAIPQKQMVSSRCEMVADSPCASGQDNLYSLISLGRTMRLARHCLLCVCVGITITAAGWFSLAYGQPLPTGFAALEQAISTGFFASGSASAGNDWCFQVAADPEENVWNFAVKSNGKLLVYPHVIDYAVRIRFVFTDVDNNNNVQTYASILMGFDLMKTSPYDATILLERKEKTKEVREPSPAPVVGTINIPNNTTLYSNCPSLGAMFPRMFYRYLTDWQSQGYPTCDDLNNGCPGVPYQQSDGTTTTYIDRQTSADTIDKYSTWSFNGKTHKIPKAIRFFVLVNGKPAYLTIGYGGNSGAG